LTSALHAQVALVPGKESWYPLDRRHKISDTIILKDSVTALLKKYAIADL
jgi:hypothetical protein